MGVVYYSVGGSNHLKIPGVFNFPLKLSLFIAVSHTRGTDHGVGLNSTPTYCIVINLRDSFRHPKSVKKSLRVKTKSF